MAQLTIDLRTDFEKGVDFDILEVNVYNVRTFRSRYARVPHRPDGDYIRGQRVLHIKGLKQGLTYGVAVGLLNRNGVPIASHIEFAPVTKKSNAVSLEIMKS